MSWKYLPKRWGSWLNSKTMARQESNTSKICGPSQLWRSCCDNSCKLGASIEVSSRGKSPNSIKSVKGSDLADLQWKKPKVKKNSSCFSRLTQASLLPSANAFVKNCAKLCEKGTTERPQMSSCGYGERVWKKSAKHTLKFCTSVAIALSSNKFSTSQPRKRRLESVELSRICSSTGRHKPNRSFKTR